MSVRVLRLVLLLAWFPASAMAQQVATVTANAPVFLFPDAKRQPLMVVGKGGTADVEAVEGEWTRVTFVDSRQLRRVAWIQTKFIAISEATPKHELTAALKQVPLPVPTPTTPPFAVVPVAQPPPKPLDKPAATRNGGRYILRVTVVDRRASESSYHYVTPTVATSTTNAYSNCSGRATTYVPTTSYSPIDTRLYVNCAGQENTITEVRPSVEYGYTVAGATFTLLLPDGRRAVVNCNPKYAFKGDYINRRSCRVPPQDDITAEFKEANAKLIWPVSIDGSKTQSETYKIVAILP
jgi:hypothetical protein